MKTLTRELREHWWAAALGAVLSICGLPLWTWQYWVILLSMIALRSWARN